MLNGNFVRFVVLSLYFDHYNFQDRQLFSNEAKLTSRENGVEKMIGYQIVAVNVRICS